MRSERPRFEDRLARLTAEQRMHRRKLMRQLAWVPAVILVPWTVYLALSLPEIYDTRHWAAAWAGFDVLELLAFAGTAYYAWRGRQALIGYAIAAATLLICDAWFDIALDLGTPGIWGSLASAVFIELPLAAFLLHRVTWLMRMTALRFYPEGDEHGRPVRLSKMPLLALLELERVAEAVEAVEAAGQADPGDESADPAGDREPGPRDTR